MSRLIVVAMSAAIFASAAYAQVPLGGVTGYRGSSAPAYHAGQDVDESVMTTTGDSR